MSFLSRRGFSSENASLSIHSGKEMVKLVIIDPCDDKTVASWPPPPYNKIPRTPLTVAVFFDCEESFYKQTVGCDAQLARAGDCPGYCPRGFQGNVRNVRRQCPGMELIIRGKCHGEIVRGEMSGKFSGECPGEGAGRPREGVNVRMPW